MPFFMIMDVMDDLEDNFSASLNFHLCLLLALLLIFLLLTKHPFLLLCYIFIQGV